MMWKRVGDVVVSWLVVGGEDRRYVVGEEEREGDEEGENCVDGVESGVVGMLWVRKSVEGMRGASMASSAWRAVS